MRTAFSRRSRADLQPQVLPGAESAVSLMCCWWWPGVDDSSAPVLMEMAFPEQVAVPESSEWVRFAQSDAQSSGELAAAEPAVRASES